MTNVIIYFDGSCKPKNPGGTACFGVSVLVDGEEINTIKGIVGTGLGMSNNVAEYAALYHVLCFLLARPRNDDVTIRGDSKLVIEQMRGNWKVNGGLYLKGYKEAKKLMDLIRLTKPSMKVKFDWIPRERNERADDLGNQAYDEWITRGMK